MPFKVQFNIYEPGKSAPLLTTQDRTLARVEYNDRCNKQGCALTRLQQLVEPVEPLTNAERYLYLVYEVRQLQHRFFHGGRDKQVFQQALDKEKALDNWNTRNRFHIQGHPKFTPDDPKAFAFFEVCEKWREKWKAYFAYKKSRDADPAVVKERSKECRDYEKQIDAYIRENIGLL